MLSIVLILGLLAAGGTAIADTGDFHYTSTLQVNVYEKPSKKSKVKFVVALGRKVVEFTRKDGFAHVGIAHMKGHDGWIKLSELSPTDPDGLKW